MVHRFGGMKARHDGTLTGGPAQRCAKQTSETWTGMLGAPTSGIKAAAAAIACMGCNPWHGMAWHGGILGVGAVANAKRVIVPTSHLLGPVPPAVV